MRVRSRKHIVRGRAREWDNGVAAKKIIKANISARAVFFGAHKVKLSCGGDGSSTCFDACFFKAGRLLTED